MAVRSFIFFSKIWFVLQIKQSRMLFIVSLLFLWMAKLMATIRYILWSYSVVVYEVIDVVWLHSIQCKFILNLACFMVDLVQICYNECWPWYYSCLRRTDNVLYNVDIYTGSIFCDYRNNKNRSTIFQTKYWTLDFLEMYNDITGF